MFASPLRNAWFWIVTLVACYLALSFRSARSDLLEASEKRPFCIEVGAVDDVTSRPLDGFQIIDFGEASVRDFQAVGDPASGGLRMRIVGVGHMPVSLTLQREGYESLTKLISDRFALEPVIFRMKLKKTANQALQTTPMARSVYEKTIEFVHPQRGV